MKSGTSLGRDQAPEETERESWPPGAPAVFVHAWARKRTYHAWVEGRKPGIGSSAQPRRQSTSRIICGGNIQPKKASSKHLSSSAWERNTGGGGEPSIGKLGSVSLPVGQWIVR